MSFSQSHVRLFNVRLHNHLPFINPIISCNPPCSFFKLHPDEWDFKTSLWKAADAPAGFLISRASPGLVSATFSQQHSPSLESPCSWTPVWFSTHLKDQLDDQLRRSWWIKADINNMNKRAALFILFSHAILQVFRTLMNAAKMYTTVRAPAESLLFCSLIIHLFCALLNSNLKHFLSVIRVEHLRNIQTTRRSSLCLSASLIHQFVSSGWQ